MSSVRSEVVVDAPQDRAFRVFTEKMSTWWPQTHHVGKSEMKDIILEKRPKGQWAEIGVDGKKTPWGHVLVFDPPRRLVLAWQLDADWAFNEKLITEVEVSFTPIGEKKTRVALEHRHLERFGDKTEQVVKAVGSEGGWQLLLNKFAEVCNSASVVASKTA
ncbi:MAG TPA: SRPBCC family protein [Thermoanaerobaculia bacterium]